MGVDIYVMPLTRYKCGDFHSPLQQLFGERLVTVSPSGVGNRDSRIEPTTIAGALRQAIASESLTQLCDAVQSVNPESTIRWEESGEVHFDEQAGCCEAARTYAKWLTYRDEFPTFEVSEADGFWSHPVWKRNDRPELFPQLARHGCYYGYFLPCEFDVMIEVEMGRPIPSVMLERSVGSSFRLRDELIEIGKDLGFSWNSECGLQSPDEFSESTAIDEAMDEGIDVEPIAFVRDAIQQLSRAAAKSCLHRLPIIFCG